MSGPAFTIVVGLAFLGLGIVLGYIIALHAQKE